MSRSSSSDRCLARLSLLAALGREAELRTEIRRARRARAPLVKIKEVFLQSFLFAGYPRMINAFLVLDSIPGCGGGIRREHGLTSERIRARGFENCAAIYGAQTEPMLRRMHEMHPDLAEWILQEGYGRVLGRRWLSPLERELCTVPVLAAQGVRTQLHSHLRGALRLGATAECVRGVLQAGSKWIGKGRLKTALSILKRLKAGNGH